MKYEIIMDTGIHTRWYVNAEPATYIQRTMQHIKFKECDKITDRHSQRGITGGTGTTPGLEWRANRSVFVGLTSLNTWLRRSTMQILVLIDSVETWAKWAKYHRVYDCPVLLSRLRAQVEPLDRSSCGRKCLLGVRTMGDHIGGICPQNRRKWTGIGKFKPKRWKIKIAIGVSP